MERDISRLKKRKHKPEGAYFLLGGGFILKRILSKHLHCGILVYPPAELKFSHSSVTKEKCNKVLDIRLEPHFTMTN